MVIAAVSVVSK